jgi:PGF-pre-PGF domain-containing protein
MKTLRAFLVLVGFVFVFSIFSSIAFAGATDPAWDENTTNTTSGSTYVAGRIYNFGINWTNSSFGAPVIDNVTFETNMTTGSTTLVNITKNNTANYTTFSNDTNGVWNISFTQEQLAGAGVYVFRWYANDTSNVWNKTDQWVYNISQGITNVTLFLDGTQGNKSYLRGASANISVVANTSYTVTVNLTTDFTSTYNASNSSQLDNATILTYAAGTNYNITGFFGGDTNYTSALQTYWLNITTTGNGGSCSAAIQCVGGYCVHNLCRSASTYCGDTYCDSGESCSSCSGDCGTCYLPPAVSSASPGEANVIISSIQPAVTKIIDTSSADVSINEIEVTTTERVLNVIIQMEESDQKPSAVATEATGSVYKYIDITATNLEDDNIEEGKLRFKVEQSWISDNSIDSATITLNRYSDAAWAELATSLLREDTEYVYYEAVTPGFSYFAISGETVVPTTTTTTTVPTTTTTSVGIPIGETGTWQMLAIVAIIVVVLVFVLYKKGIIKF